MSTLVVPLPPARLEYSSIPASARPPFPLSTRDPLTHSYTHATPRHARIGWHVSLIVPTTTKLARATAAVSCANCQAALPKALTCKRCKATKYCTKECQVMRRVLAALIRGTSVMRLAGIRTWAFGDVFGVELCTAQMCEGHALVRRRVLGVGERKRERRHGR